MRDLIIRCPFEDSYLDFKNSRKLNLSERVKNFVTEKSDFFNKIGLTKTQINLRYSTPENKKRKRVTPIKLSKPMSGKLIDG